MGTTAEKGQRVLQSIAEVQEGINNLGGNLTDQTLFKNFRAELDNIYNSLPKTSYAEGSNITLSNTLKGKLDFEDGIVGIGDTKQESTTGRQLFDYTTISATSNCTNNNGVITSDTYSSPSMANLFINFGTININAGDTIYFSCDMKLKGSGSGNFNAYSDRTNNYTITLKPTLSTTYQKYQASFTYSANATFLSMMIQFSNLVGSIEISNIMISKNSSTEWEKYTGGIPSPNPSYPQDIEVVRGKNRLNISRENISIGGATSTINYDDEGYITITNNNSSASYINIPIATEEIQAGEQYTLKVEWGTSELTYIYLQNSNDDYSKYVYTTTTTTATNTTISNFLKVLVLVNANKTIKVRLQVEKGSQATSYLPYNTLEVAERGKNLLNTANGSVAYKPEGTITIDSKGVINASIDMSYASINIPSITLKAGKTYTFKRNFTGSRNSWFVDTNNNNVLGIGYNKTSVTATIESDVTINKLNGALLSGDNYFQLETGSTATDFEPYQTPRTYQLSLGEYEFAKIGNYVDTIEYDIDNDKVYKNENIKNKKASQLTTSDLRYATQGIYITGIGGTKTKTDVFSNCFINKTSTDSAWNELNGLYISHLYNNYDNIYINKIYSNAQMSEALTWLNSINFEMYFPLETPVKIEITTALKDQIKALYNSHSFNGTTIIEINGQLPLIIKVRALKG